ncbi:hypothetical protein [Oceaniglobus ichthyenteri]|uniref:hypothetical protein n=1 Tax=Oceaniglobus ichthyenteri TaxID=2136177 RepID=UPI00197D9060|nr:hypothetical protein [Oceaniglobus ichthyenteri]
MKYVGHLIAVGMPFIAWSAPAHAYIDPGTGTLIVQGLVGSFVAVATIGGLYLQRVRAAIGRVFGRPAGAEGDELE